MALLELNDLEDSTLEAKLLELLSLYSPEMDVDENVRLQCELQVQGIKLELQRRALEALTRERDEARARFENLYDGSPIPYATFDAQGRLLEINCSGAALLGMEQEQLPGTPLAPYLAAGEARFLQHIKQVLASGQRSSLDVQLHDRRGKRYDVRILSDRHGGENRPVCISTLIDLTEQKQIERGIRRSDDFSRSVLNALPAQIAVVDGAGTILAVNEYWRNFAKNEDAPPVVRGDVGQDYLKRYRDTSHVPFREAPLVFAGITAVLDGKEPEFKLEYSCHTPTQKRWFLVWVTPLMGQNAGAVVTHVDISARMLAQEEARDRGEALASAARLSSVGALASALAHEITQPLTSVGQFSSTAVAMLYSGESKSHELAEILLHIDGEVQRAGEVMRRLRAFMGRGSGARLPVNLHQIVDMAIGLIHLKAVEKKIDIVPVFADDSLDVAADKIQITQVLVNLLYNSIEAIDRADSPVRNIYVHCERDKDLIHIRVCDTGPGLDPELKESIFDLFETDRARGAGMGLAISRSIIEEHRGKLWAESRTGDGAVFHFTLPAMHKEMDVE